MKCFACGSYGHVSVNCRNKQKGNGKGKQDPGKGPGVSQSSWEKGKGKSQGKPKGKSGKPGKGFGKKGKLNELSEYHEDDWWWYENDWSTYGQDWSIDHVGQWYDQHDGWNEEWKETSWETQEKGHTEGGSVASVKIIDKTDGGKTEKPVGSLILSPLFGEFAEDSSFCRFHLDGSDARPQPFSGSGRVAVPDEFPLVGSDVCPQPFLGSEKVVPELQVHGGSLNFFEESDGEVVDPASGQRVFKERRDFEDNFHFSRLIGGNEHDTRKEGFFEGLLVERPMKCRKVKFCPRTFLNFEDTMSHEAKLQRFGVVFSPLLSELSHEEDIGWWLLDSGAAVTVLAKHCAVPYAAEVVRSSEDAKFSAANGSSVRMHGRAEVSVFMCLRNDQQDSKFWKKGNLTVLVGDTRHNILSTTSLAQSGWQFKHGSDGVSLTHEATGDMACELAVFAGCPWIRLHPHAGIDRSHEELDLSVEGRESGVFCPLSKAARAELEQHRKQGHVPHNPHCVECARARGTHQHRRRSGDVIETELQASFRFLSQAGEVSDVEKQGSVKVLVLTECQSNAVGYVVVGDDMSRTRGLILKWIQHFGLESEQPSIVLHTDAEQAVRRLITDCSPKYVFHVRKSRINNINHLGQQKEQ